MPLTSEELSALIAKLDEVTAEMVDHGARLEVTDKRSRKASNTARVGIIVGIIGACVGIGGVLVGVEARATAEELAKSRRESQASGCVQANITTQANRAALVQGLLAIIPPGQEPTESQQEIVRRYTSQVEAALPFRDCSERGLAAYYDHPPADPALRTATSSTVVTR